MARDTIGGNVFNFLGLTSPSLPSSSLAPHVPNAERDTQAFHDFGALGNPEIWTQYGLAMTRPSTYTAMLQSWREMATWDLLATALVQIVDEVVQQDDNNPASLWFECDDRDFEDELNDMLIHTLDIDTILPSQAWFVAALGNNFDKVEYARGEGIKGLHFVDPQNIRRYWLKKNRQCVGFKWSEKKPDKTDLWADGTGREIHPVALADGSQTEELWYPWDFCFTGDTKISLLDGREMSLVDIQNEVGEGEFWVYSSTPDGRVMPGRAHSLRLTRKNTKIVEVELDNGEKVRCTPDHKFMLRDGSYCVAENLALDASLMPLRQEQDPKVVAVRCAGTSDVYDFEVEDHHNFALSAGVFVHNCHMRRMYRLRESEHGEPIYDEASSLYKKMRLALDQMVVTRAQIQPDRYLIDIDVQEQGPADQMRTVNRWKQAFRSKLAFGTGANSNGGDSSDPDKFQSFYNALGLDSVLYMAKPKGFSHGITKIPGTPDVPDVYDVELLTNLFFSVLAIPKSWLGIGGDGSSGPVSGKALLAQDIRFLRKVKNLRRPIMSAYRKLGYFHAMLKGKDPDSLNIKVKMSEIGALDDQLKMEMLKTQAETLNELGTVMQTYNLPREAWVDVVFRKYLHMPEEIVNAFLTALPPEAEGVSESTKRTLGVSGMIKEVDRNFGNNPRVQRLLKDLQETIRGNKVERRDRPPSVVEDMHENIEDGDLIVNALGEGSALSVRGGPNNVKDVKAPLMEGGRKGWAQYNYSG